jgi:hypothetical protein
MCGELIMTKIKIVLFIVIALPVLVGIILFCVPSHYDTDI